MKILTKTLCLLLICSLIFFCCKKDGPPPPKINTLEPLSGSVGTNVTLFGENLNYWNSIKIGDSTYYSGFFGTSDGKTLNITIPDQPSGEISIYLEYEEGESNIKKFTITEPASQITSVNPGEGCVGDTIIITGLGFPQMNTEVIFFDNSQPSQQVITDELIPLNDSMIQVIVPMPSQGIEYSHIQIMGDNGLSNTYSFQLLIPQITGISPVNPVPADATSLEIYGVNFKEMGEVFFSGDPLEIISYSDTLIIVQLEPNDLITPISGPLIVQNINGESDFDIVIAGQEPAPIVFEYDYTVSPNCQIMLSGQYLDLITSYEINGESFPVNNSSTDEWDFTLPSTISGNSLEIAYFSDNGLEGTVTFPNIVTDTIKSIIPSIAVEGAPIFIYGNKLENVDGVYFNDVFIEIGNNAGASAEYIAFPIDSYARQFFDSEGFIVTRVPDVISSATGDLVIKAQLKMSGCLIEPKEVKVNSANTSFINGIPHDISNIPFVNIPTGNSLGSISNNWCVNGFSDFFLLGDDCFNCTDTFTIVDVINDNEYVGFYVKDGSYCRIKFDGDWYSGYQQNNPNLISIINPDNSIFPLQLLLYNETNGASLEMAFPGIINLQSINNNSNNGYTIIIEGEKLDQTLDQLSIYPENTFPISNNDLQNIDPNLIISLFPESVNSSQAEFEFDPPQGFILGDYQIVISDSNSGALSNPITLTFN